MIKGWMDRSIYGSCWVADRIVYYVVLRMYTGAASSSTSARCAQQAFQDPAPLQGRATATRQLGGEASRCHIQPRQPSHHLQVFRLLFEGSWWTFLR